MRAARARLQMAGKLLRSPSSSPSTICANATTAAPSSSSCFSSSTSMAASTFEQKKQLRSRIRRELRTHHSSLRETEDLPIQNHILDAPWYKDSLVVCAYLSTPSLREVDTTLIVSDMLRASQSDPPKMLLVPWVEDNESHMKFFHITSTKDLCANSMGILEPTPNEEGGNPREDVMQVGEPVDLILLPGLAFDRAGRRLGRGGGYYDTFLLKYLHHAEERGWKPPLLVGLAYSLQIIDGVVPTCATDVPVDALVSSSGVLPITNHFRLAHE